MKSAALRTVMVCLSLISLVGCEDEQRVVTYTVPKSAAPAQGRASSASAPMAAAPGMAESAAGFDAPSWVAPESWRAQPLSPMRKGDWKMGPADAEAQLAVTVFAGDVGGLAANVNRWAQQIGMPPLSSAELKKAVTALPLTGSPEAVLVRLEHDGRATLSLSAPHAGATWFFKLSGPAETVAGAEADFRKFAESVKFPAAK